MCGLILHKLLTIIVHGDITVRPYFYFAAVPLFVVIMIVLSTGDAIATAEPISAVSEKSTEITLNEIKSDLKKRHLELEQKSSVLRKTKNPQEKKELEAEIVALNQLITDQEKSFKMIVTGGLEQALIEDKQVTKFDWQKDLMDVLQPILSELRELTAHKRKLENLKNRINFHQAQIETVNEALSRINAINHKGLQPAALSEYKKIKANWQQKVTEHQHLMEVANLQMDEMLKPDDIEKQSINEIIKRFFVGRGATLLMATFAAGTVFFLLRLFQDLIKKIFAGKTQRKSRTTLRLLGILYKVATVTLSIAAIFVVFHQRGDRVLQAFAILFLIAIIWVLKNSIPQVIGEVRLLLNIGMVREGERINYGGLPWLVDQLNVYCSLINPAIVGGKIRVPIQVLTDMHSRRSHKDEPWFPCRMGDRVILDDGVYGQVEIIAMDGVALRLAGGSIKSYGIGDFLATNPLNLSSGFNIAMIFGIGYSHQARCTGDVAGLFKEGIFNGLKSESYGEHLVSISCEFDEAAASSLNYKILVDFEGKAANSYNPIKRAIQRYAVDVCNENNFEIPFNQLTVHHIPANA